MKRANAGFTLLEVMIALSIFAVTASVIAVANTQALRGARQIEEQTQARWVAQNYLTELRLQNALPDAGVNQETVEYNNQNWVIETEVNLIEIELIGPRLRNIQIRTRLANEDAFADTLIAVLAEPEQTK